MVVKETVLQLFIGEKHSGIFVQLSYQCYLEKGFYVLNVCATVLVGLFLNLASCSMFSVFIA